MTGGYMPKKKKVKKPVKKKAVLKPRAVKKPKKALKPQKKTSQKPSVKKAKEKHGRKTPLQKQEPMARLLLPLGRIKEIFRTRYGFFLYDGSEFVINTPETPSPWSNILTNNDYGMMISQSGCGMSFKAGMGNKITRWNQDAVSENYGKFIYIRDNQTEDFWSAAWKPVCKKPEFYEVRHGIGYTNISSKNNGIISSLIYYVSADEPVEICQMRLKNTTDEKKFLSVFSYLEWDSGRPSGNREYDRLFVNTSYDEKLTAVMAEFPDEEYAFHSANKKAQTFTCGREFFLGAYRDASNPRCVEKGMCFGECGRYADPAAALHIDIELDPKGEKEIIFTTGKCAKKTEAERIVKKYKDIKVVEEEFSRTGHRWTVRFSGLNITTPDEGANILTNKWFRYQAISAGLSAAGSAYSLSCGTVFKDYIINGLVLLSVSPKYFRQIIIECAQMQFEDGSVFGKWDPASKKGERSESFEIPLWFVYAVCEYLKETKDMALLDEDVRFQDGPKKSVFIHCKASLERTLSSLSKRGLIAVYPGDHAEKLDSSSDNCRCESVWAVQFLVLVMSEFMKLCVVKKEKQAVSDYESRLKKISEKINKAFSANDGFTFAVLPSGVDIGARKGKNPRIFLDTQTWPVISGLCDAGQAEPVLDKAGAALYKEHGPVILSTCFDAPDKSIGTISRLPKGVMENGGISIESACWAIWAETKLLRGHNAWNIYTKLDPVDRSHKSDIYKLEPFVCCEYVDGPEALTNGRARNSWYNRGAYWMFKVMVERILGIRPEYEGLRISPCIPNRWKLFKLRRSFRNAYYTIEVLNSRYVSSGIAEITVDGKEYKTNLIPAFGDDKRHHVKVVMGKPVISA
jgi:cellobiose phosphorylase